MAQKKILVVDDELDILEVIKGRLEFQGYKVILAAGGEEGLEKIKSEKPDLVVLDIVMPKMNGWEVLKRIRDDEATRELPVIMLTAKGDTEAILESQRLKATDYFIKPFVAEEFCVFIERYIL